MARGAADFAALIEERLGVAPESLVVDGTDVVLVRTEGDVFAISALCSHAAVPLVDGDVEKCALECYMHGAMFDLHTGKPLSLPATEPVPVYPVTIDGDDVLVDVVDAVRSAFDHRDVDGVVTGITDSQTSPEPGVASVR